MAGRMSLLDSLPSISITCAIGAIIFAIFFLFERRNREKLNQNINKDEKSDDKDVKKDPPRSESKKASKAKSKKDAVPVHKRQFCVLKGHTDVITGLDFSDNGKYLATCSTDRTVRLWSVKDFKEKEHKYIRGNVDYDHANEIKFSPDCRAFVTAVANGNTIKVFKVTKKEKNTGGTVQCEMDFPVHHKSEIISIAVASHGKYIMSCSKDTTILVWDLKGEVLSTIDTHQVTNSFANISPCGRFIASAGFTPDVKLWEVEFDKSDGFKQVTRAMDLKGHTAGVYHFSFSQDCTRMATVSKDGTWRVWDIDVEYEKNQDPYLLITGIYDANFGTYSNMLICMSPDAYVVAIAMGHTIGLFNTETGNVEELLEDVHADNITSLAWHPSSRFLASAGGGDRHVRVWHNAAGIRVMVDHLEAKKAKAKGDNHKARINAQLEEARALLEKINKPPELNT